MKTQQYNSADNIGNSLVLNKISTPYELLSFFGAKEQFGNVKLANSVEQLQPKPQFYDQVLEVANFTARQFQTVVELAAKEWLVFGGKANGYLNDVHRVKRGSGENIHCN